MGGSRFFSNEEYRQRLDHARARLQEQGLQGCVVVEPENIYYLCGLDHMGYFAYQALVVPLEGTPILVTRAMERATVGDQVEGVEHIGYSDGAAPLPPPRDRAEDVLMSGQSGAGNAAGLRPWEMSLGVDTRAPGMAAPSGRDAVRATHEAIQAAGLAGKRVGIEKNSSFFPLRIAEALFADLPDVEWQDASALVADCRLVQSAREIQCTRQAATVSDAMMLSAIAAAGPGVPKRDVMAAVYDAMVRRGGTYPGFVPLVRSTRTLTHEHGTWDDTRLGNRDMLFLEMAGCVRRYHAPIGRLVFIGRAPARAEPMLDLCREALESASRAIGPGAKAADVYSVWQGCLDRAGMQAYSRHHCGYAVGIGYPPSWSGGGVPIGLRKGSSLELRAGMVFHLMSWLLRTGRGDSFLSDTVLVTEDGCEFLTSVSRDLTVR